MTQWVDFKTVREHLSFRDVLAHYGIEESGSGDQIKIICPFHNDHKPSCGVNLEKLPLLRIAVDKLIHCG